MNSTNSKADAETQALIAELWQRYLPTTHERLDILDRLAAKSATQPLSKQEHDEVIAISHKFAGNLGMYGFPKGSEFAMKIEQLFRSVPSPSADTFRHLTTSMRESIFPTR